MLSNPSDPGRQTYLELCIKGYQNLFASFRFFEAIVRGLLTMAVHKGASSVVEAHTVIKNMHDRGKHHRIPDELKAIFMLDLDLAMTNPGEARAESLAEKLRDVLTAMALMRHIQHTNIEHQYELPGSHICACVIHQPIS